MKKQKKQRAKNSTQEELVEGTLRVHPRGFGFLLPDHPEKHPQDIFIPKHLTDNAVDGDKVEVAITAQSLSEKGPEGKVVSILKRGRTHLCATIHHLDSKGTPIAYSPLLGTSKQVVVQKEEGDPPLHIGDRLILKVLEWGEEKEKTICTFSHFLGHISDPSCDIAAAIEEFDLPSAFSKEALKEARAFGEEVRKKDLKGRKDLSKLTCFTIDPETAKDFDDALSLTKDRQGNYHLGVHIADAAHYVKEKSALDKEAAKRCNSTYFPQFCLPMLPEELSTHLCSLRPNVVRLTISALITFDPEGNLLHYEIERSFIKSKKRFTYPEALHIIEGKKSRFSAPLKLMVELCHLLKKKRFERGSIDFSLPETYVEVDSKGAPLGLKTVEYDISHQLVEEFMLKANEVVAMHLSKQNKALLFRIHNAPSTENIEEFFTLARSLGFTVPKEPKTEDLQNLFNEAKSSPYHQQLAVAFIRSMKLAYYSPENVGHFGLALEYYCHFTSPIRRYSDLIIQRLLCGEEGKVVLEKIALKCSEQERISFRAESSVKQLKKLRLLQKNLLQDPKKEYKAMVTRIKPFGIVFEVTDLMLEGFLHISELENDYFLFDPRKSILRGRSSGKVHAAGEMLSVRASSVDLIMQESTWELATENKRKRKR